MDQATANIRMLEKARKDSIRQALGIQEEPKEPTQQPVAQEPPPEPAPQNNSGVVEDSQGAPEDNQYISNQVENPTTEQVGSVEEPTNIESVLNKVFKGDVSNLEKSYLESQREFGKVNSQLTEALKAQGESERTIANINAVLNQNPTLRNAFEKAVKGEDVESLIIQKPEGKSEVPTNNGKFSEVQNEFLPDVNRLIELGYLSKDKVEALTDQDRQSAVLQAQAVYMQRELPNLVTQQVNSVIAKANEEKANADRLKELQDTNNSRINNGFDNVIKEHGLEFSGKDRDLFDEIFEEAKSFRDRGNPQLLRENAIELATREVLAKHGRSLNANLSEEPPTQTEPKRQFSTSDKPGKTSRETKKELTLEERMSQRHLTNSSREFTSIRDSYQSRKNN